MVKILCYFSGMKVDSIKSYVTPKTTGYSATAALGIAVLSGVSKNKSFRKTHKPFAYISAFLTAVHIALIESYKKCNKNTRKSLH